MDKSRRNGYGTGFGIAVVILILLGFFAYTTLEIYPKPRHTMPSREARNNDYLALDRWLVQTGRPVRVNLSGDPALILSGPEKIALVQPENFTWSPASYETLRPWLEDGGSLVLLLEEPWYDNEDFMSFLGSFGVQWKTDYYDEYDDDTEQAGDEAGEESGEAESAETAVTETAETAEDAEEPGPALDWWVQISWIEGAEIPENCFILEEPPETIRLLKIPVGRGSLTVTGTPYFMYSSNLSEELNARLSWFLTGEEDRENLGILFIRGQEAGSRGLTSVLAKRGNLTALAVSALALVVIGFWMVIPVFGRFAREDERPGRPIRERFLAEGRFLKKHGALGFYFDTYLQEINSRLRRPCRRQGSSGSAKDGEMIRQALQSKKAGWNVRNLIKSIETAENILERV